MPEQNAKYQRYLELIAGLRLMDDNFFSEALDGKIAPVQYILNTILERDDLRVLHTEAQVEYKSATRRSIKLDIRAVDTEGRVMDIEIQRAEQGAGVRRARFHSSMIDRTLLAKGDDFEDLVDTYVIFITEKDKFSAGLPLYHVERTIPELNHTVFGDGAHIIYVNAKYRDDTEFGHLMHDLHCKRAQDMYSQVLAKRVQELKETQKGVKIMSHELEKLYNEGIEKGEMVKAKEITHSLGEMGMPAEKIAQAVKMSVSVVQEWLNENVKVQN